MQHRRPFITKSACQSNWTAHACIPLASLNYLTQNTLRMRDNKSWCSFAHTASVDCYCWHFLVCGSFSRAVPLMLCLSSWVQKMQLLSLSRGTEGGGYSEVPNFALWPLFASFSHFLFDFKMAVYPPQRATFFILQSHTQWTEGCFELTSLLQTKVSGEKELLCVFPRLGLHSTVSL